MNALRIGLAILLLPLLLASMLLSLLSIACVLLGSLAGFLGREMLASYIEALPSSWFPQRNSRKGDH